MSVHQNDEPLQAGRAYELAFLVGFDRCGSSFIAKLLAHHPAIELIFQPFNSTEITQRQWEIWPAESPEAASPETLDFLGALANGSIAESYIRSDWHANHSTTREITRGRLHVVKDTKLHFKFRWLQRHFPQFGYYGLWRDPRGILGSLVRNDFHNTWYGAVDHLLLATIAEQDSLFDHYKPMISKRLNAVERMALAIAMRVHFMMEAIPSEHWLVYEKVVIAPNDALNAFVKRYNLAPFDFETFARADFNIAGKQYEGVQNWKQHLPESSLPLMEKIFRPLLDFQRQWLL